MFHIHFQKLFCTSFPNCISQHYQINNNFCLFFIFHKLVQIFYSFLRLRNYYCLCALLPYLTRKIEPPQSVENLKYRDKNIHLLTFLSTNHLIINSHSKQNTKIKIRVRGESSFLYNFFICVHY